MKYVIVIFCSAIFIWSLPLFFFLNSSNYYFFQFERYQVFENFQGYEESFLKEKFQETLDYINWRSDFIDQEFFSYEDQIHLQDVKNIVLVFYVLTFLSFLVSLLVFFKDKYSFLKSLVRASFLNLVVSVILILLVMLDFSSIFVAFHKILFRNDYWMLDPNTSNLIKYFPEVIFSEIATILTTFVIITSILIITIWILKIKKFLSQADI